MEYFISVEREKNKLLLNSKEGKEQRTAKITHQVNRLLKKKQYELGNVF